MNKAQAFLLSTYMKESGEGFDGKTGKEVIDYLKNKDLYVPDSEYDNIVCRMENYLRDLEEWSNQ
jgi:hypothetical protein